MPLLHSSLSQLPGVIDRRMFECMVREGNDSNVTAALRCTYGVCVHRRR
jgi:hypothetical protein